MTTEPNIIEGRNWRVIVADVMDGLRSLEDESVHCAVTSPPYFGLRDYGVDGQIGLEKTPAEFVAKMVEVFREVRRVLRKDGTCFVNMGDSYASAWPAPKNRRNLIEQAMNGGKRSPMRESRLGGALKEKDLMGVPWRLAFALQEDGWYLRQDIIWSKRSPMPESVTDRCTKAHEYIFLLTKRERYFWDQEAVREVATSDYPAGDKTHKYNREGIAADGGPLRIANGLANLAGIEWQTRNLRSVWTISSEPYIEAHFATFPSEIPRRCIKAGTSEKGCCSACGAPWWRVTEKTKLRRERPNELTKRNGSNGTGNHCANTVAGVAVQTTGWQQSCNCNAEVAPCVVLDPFSGSGTTGMVATELGRQYIGIELNPAYAELSRKRIESWKYRSVEKQLEPLAGQKELF